MAKTLEKLFTLQYEYAYQLSKNGEEDEAQEYLLDLLTKPRLSHYRRGLASLLIVSICISQGAYESNPIDAESFAKHTVDAFREELAGESLKNRDRVAGLLTQAEEALEDIRGIKVARERYRVMEDLVRQAKEIADEDGKFWRTRWVEEEMLKDGEAAKDEAAKKRDVLK